MRKLLALMALVVPTSILGLAPVEPAARCLFPEEAREERATHNERNDERIYHVWCGGAL